MDIEATIRALKIMSSLAGGQAGVNRLMALGAKKAGRLNFAASCEGAAAGHQWCINEIQQVIDRLERKVR